jgi:hypothetical protein
VIVLLREVLPALVLLALVGWLAWWALSGWRGSRALRRARWAARVRSLENRRVAVEVARPGEATQVVAELDPATDGFETELYEARARAENLAATLNAARR